MAISKVKGNEDTNKIRLTRKNKKNREHWENLQGGGWATHSIGLKRACVWHEFISEQYWLHHLFPLWFLQAARQETERGRLQHHCRPPLGGNLSAFALVPRLHILSELRSSRKFGVLTFGVLAALMNLWDSKRYSTKRQTITTVSVFPLWHEECILYLVPGRVTRIIKVCL